MSDKRQAVAVFLGIDPLDMTVEALRRNSAGLMRIATRIDAQQLSHQHDILFDDADVFVANTKN